MNIISCGVSGSKPHGKNITWDRLAPDVSWQALISVFCRNEAPRQVQIQALKQGLLRDCKNVIVSAPTNAGKTLLGWLVLFEAIMNGQRAVLLEPLRAIAQEKADYLNSLLKNIHKILGSEVKVIITTGDYRLNSETFSSPVSEKGELIIATPERMESIITNPKNKLWLETIGAVCVDEAHLLSSPRRGPTFDFVISSMLTLPQKPRIIFLSATIGSQDEIKTWLSPCELISSTERVPPLEKEIVIVDSGENSNDIVADLVRDALIEPDSQVLVFVYQTGSTESLAKYLSNSVKDLAGTNTVLPYHSKMSSSERQRVSQLYLDGHCKCLISTTALGMGVNLPATDVIIRDNTFPGVGPLSSNELLQMMGRAGRGNNVGKAIVLVKTGDDWGGQELAEVLRNEEVAPMESPFVVPDETDWGRKSSTVNMTMRVSQYLAGLISRYEEGISREGLSEFLDNSWSGKHITRFLPEALSWLCDNWNALAYIDQNEIYNLTVLGKHAVHASLPLDVAAGFARIIRDLITLSSEDHLLPQWKPMDSLVVLDLLSKRSPNLRSFSSKLVDQVDGWMERYPDRIPIVYKWFAGSESGSRAGEIMATLGISNTSLSKKKKDWARQNAYLAMVRSIVLYELSQGNLISDLERQWKVKNLEGVEERWRDDYLWLLSGLADMFELRCFYYHLLEECSAGPERIKRVKKILRDLHLQTIFLREQIKYCSTLGPMILNIKKQRGNRKGPSVGVATLRTLEEAGVKYTHDLLDKTVDEVVEMGVRRDLAKQIYGYVNRGI